MEKKNKFWMKLLNIILALAILFVNAPASWALKEKRSWNAGNATKIRGDFKGSPDTGEGNPPGHLLGGLPFDHPDVKPLVEQYQQLASEGKLNTEEAKALERKIFELTGEQPNILVRGAAEGESVADLVERQVKKFYGGENSIERLISYFIYQYYQRAAENPDPYYKWFDETVVKPMGIIFTADFVLNTFDAKDTIAEFRRLLPNLKFKVLASKPEELQKLRIAGIKDDDIIKNFREAEVTFGDIDSKKVHIISTKSKFDPKTNERKFYYNLFAEGTPTLMAIAFSLRSIMWDDFFKDAMYMQGALRVNTDMMEVNIEEGIVLPFQKKSGILISTSPYGFVEEYYSRYLTQKQGDFYHSRPSFYLTDAFRTAQDNYRKHLGDIRPVRGAARRFAGGGDKALKFLINDQYTSSVFISIENGKVELGRFHYMIPGPLTWEKTYDLPQVLKEKFAYLARQYGVERIQIDIDDLDKTGKSKKDYFKEAILVFSNPDLAGITIEENVGYIVINERTTYLSSIRSIIDGGSQLADLHRADTIVHNLTGGGRELEDFLKDAKDKVKGILGIGGNTILENGGDFVLRLIKETKTSDFKVAVWAGDESEARELKARGIEEIVDIFEPAGFEKLLDRLEDMGIYKAQIGRPEGDIEAIASYTDLSKIGVGGIDEGTFEEFFTYATILNVPVISENEASINLMPIVFANAIARLSPDELKKRYKEFLVRNLENDNFSVSEEARRALANVDDQTLTIPLATTTNAQIIDAQKRYAEGV